MALPSSRGSTHIHCLVIVAGGEGQASRSKNYGDCGPHSPLELGPATYFRCPAARLFLNSGLNRASPHHKMED